MNGIAVGGYRALAGELSAGTLISFQMLQAGVLGPLESLLQTLLRLEIIPILFDRMDDVPSTQAEPDGEVAARRLPDTLPGAHQTVVASARSGMGT